MEDCCCMLCLPGLHWLGSAWRWRSRCWAPALTPARSPRRTLTQTITFILFWGFLKIIKYAHIILHCIYIYAQGIRIYWRNIRAPNSSMGYNVFIFMDTQILHNRLFQAIFLPGLRFKWRYMYKKIRIEYLKLDR